MDAPEALELHELPRSNERLREQQGAIDSRAVERQRPELARFVSPQVAALLSSERGEQPLLAGHRAHVFVPVLRLRGSTAFTETAAPEETLELLCEYHGSASSDRPGTSGFDVGLGIGIAAGYATVGRIGFEGRYDYGVVGPVTNLASRLSTHAAPGQTLISQRVLAEVEGLVDATPVGECELKGFARPDCRL